MRRTYRSKKDTGGGIDHRDMVLSMDAKSSVFDAFYIQNIKQVKRELSCVGTSNPYTAASNKVRKRKYVKRLKEPEPVRESLSESAYLTPDKSIRVNKVPDLFDQILNSSVNFSPKTSTNYPKGTAKTYRGKKMRKPKKCNFSSDEYSGSDKENAMSDESDLSHNTSNIKTYKLMIEPEKMSSPVKFDDSIQNIVKKFPILSKLSKDSFRESVESSPRFSSVKFDVTQSPLHLNSPQCSTPFHEKHRGKSIYRFSPIRNDVTHNFEAGTPEQENKVDNSVISCKTTDNILNNVDQSDLAKNNTAKDDLAHKSIKQHELVQRNQSVDCFQETVSSHSIKSKHFLSNDTSSLEITECEPFLGFSMNNLVQNNENEYVTIKRYKEILGDNCSLETNIEDLKGQSFLTKENDVSDSSISSNNTTVNFEAKSNNSSVISEDAESVSMYNTCDSDNISELSSSEEVNKKEAIVVMERMSDSVFQKYLEKMNYSSGNDTSSISDREDMFSNVNESEYGSFEDTADITNSSVIEEHNEVDSIQNDISSSINDLDPNESEEENTVSFVTTRRRVEMPNDSFVLNLSNSYSSNSSVSLDKTVLSCNREKLEKSDIDILCTDIDVENETLVNNSIASNGNEADGELSDATEALKELEMMEADELFHIDEEDANINTRKSSRVFRDSLKQNETLVNHTESFNDNNETHMKLSDSAATSTKPEITEHSKLVHSDFDEEVTNINSRKSSRLFRDSVRSSHINFNESFGPKQGIVLKPGKKWERSLSIYRRMTTMGDTFDHSILDSESLKTKGRKYRQSVISTMELQEHQGSLHNESVISRRSTFVSKPHRSTIKIIQDPNASSVGLCSSVIVEDLQGFLNGDCDDTIVDLSKLSLGDSAHEVTILDKFHDTPNRILTARDYVLRRCNQTESILFDECYPDPVLKNCRKIGEGVYGEVFLWRAGDGRARVMKIVPIAGTTKVNGEDQKDYHEIISEIVIAMELSALRAPIPEIERHLDDGKGIDTLDLQSIQNATDVFNEVLAVRCVHGAYPSRLLDLWELYDETRGSENDSPAALPAHQQYLVLELANAGQDLESYQFHNAEQACALFKQRCMSMISDSRCPLRMMGDSLVQIALGLAVAEEALQFEHRDLHWGNVLIAPTDQKLATFVIRGRLHRTARCGVAATLIDYSLSRAARNGRALYNDLAHDDALFDAVGDYQFELYRLMRDKLGNDWKNYEPYTNILWLHYTLDKMITALRYTRTNTKIHKHYIAKLKEIKNRVLDYGSATQFVLTDNEF